MIIPSASLDKVDVREIGLKSLVKSQMVDTFGSGQTSAIFQIRGTLQSRKDVLRMSVIGVARDVLISFNLAVTTSSID